MTYTTGSGGRPRDSSERVDTLFRALADEQRRQVVCYFRTVEDDVASVVDLVNYAGEDNSGDQTLDRLETTFRHATLPKLAELGIIEYDVQCQTVRYCGSPELEQILTVVVEMDLSAD